MKGEQLKDGFGIKNLMQRLLDELNRNRELKSEYDTIGSAGLFGSEMIQSDINAGEAAIAYDDVVAMLKAYEKLKGNE